MSNCRRPYLLLEGRDTVVVPTPMRINKVSVHGEAGEPELLLLKDVVAVGATCDIRARGGGRTAFVVFLLMSFRFHFVSSRMKLSRARDMQFIACGVTVRHWNFLCIEKPPTRSSCPLQRMKMPRFVKIRLHMFRNSFNITLQSQ